MRRVIKWLTAAAIVSLPALSWALPNEFVQEGLIIDAQGRALDGAHEIVMRLYATDVGGAPLWSETHADVAFFDGYYAVSLGSIQALAPSLFTRDEIYLSVAIDGGAELSPRTPLVKVPAAFAADVARNVTGDITPNSVAINGQPVIDVNGRWVGDPTGLVGPRGPQGAQGPQGPQGAAGQAGQAGGDGSPDTPAQVLAKLLQVDGAGSGLEADLIDGLDASRFMRTDQDTGTTGRVTTGDGLLINSAGRAIVSVIGGAAGDVGRLLRLEPQNDAGEGGHLHVAGSGNDQDWAIDNSLGNLRFYEPAPSRDQARRDGNILFFRPGGTVNMSVSGNLSASAISASNLTINGRQVIDGNGKLNQAQWDLYSEVRVLTNQAGVPDHNMYFNYPNRADSRSYLYNDPVVNGTLTATGNVLLGGSRIFDSGTTITCEAGGGALGACPNSGHWAFDKIVLTHDTANAPARMAATGDASMSVEGQIHADSQITTNGALRVGGQVYLGGSTIFDVGTTFTCESGGGALGNCPNSGSWTFDKIVLEHSHADVAGRMAAIPTGSINIEGQVRADGPIITLNNVSAAGQLQAGTSALSAGLLKLGNGANERITAAQLATLVGGGNADALHTHAGLGNSRPWVRIGNLNDYAGNLARYPHTHWEYGVTYNTRTILPVVISGWNAGLRVVGQYDYIRGDRFPNEGGGSFTHGGAVWFMGTRSVEDDACNNASTWYHRYYYRRGDPNSQNGFGETEWSGGNGCSVPSLYVREF